MHDEDFLQEMRDYFRIEAQRHRDIMTSNQDVIDAIAALPVAALTAALTQLKTSVNTAVSDMGSGGDAARASFVAALTATATALSAVATQIGTIETELTAAIAAAVPPPAQSPSP